MAAPRLPSPYSLLAARNQWELATEVVLIGMLLFSPLALGAVEAWSELVVILAAAVLSLLVALRTLFDRTFHVFWTWACLPLVLFILLAGLQVLPLPTGLVERLSESTLATKTELLGASPEWTALSFYPLAGFHGLRLLLVGTAVFVATLLTFQRVEQIRVLLAAVFAAGVIVAVIALLQILTLAPQIYWSIGTEGGIATAGPFVNHSHFSQFMNLAIGAGLALLLVRLREEEDEATGWRQRTTGGTPTPSSGSSGWGHADRSFGSGGDRDTGLTVSNGWIVAGLVVCAVSVFTSLSRNGALSLAVAATVVGTALYWRRILTWRGWLLAVLPWCALGALLVVGFDAVYERLASLQEEHDWSFRWEMTAGALRAWREYPIWGTGLGTHEYVFPMFDRSAVTSIAAHADNDYAQLLEEMGVLGAGLVLAFLGIVGAHALRLIRGGQTPLSAAAFGLALGLIAVAIHSASDFGQHLPAVFSLSAVACGLLINIDRIERAQREQAAASRPASAAGVVKARLLWGGATVLGLALVWSWAVRDAYAAYVGANHWADALATEAQLAEQNWQGTNEEFVDLLSSASAAADAVPNNVKYAYWLNLYRWYSISRTVDEETGEVLLHPASLPFVERIADEFARARRICPTFGPPYAMEGQLRLFVLGEPSGSDLIRKGYELASYDPQTCLVAGRLAATDGDEQEAVERLTRAVELQPSSYREVAGIFLFGLGRPDLAMELAGDDYSRLASLARMAASSEQHAALEAKLTARAHAVLRERASAPDAKVSELSIMARIESELGNLEAAASLYRRAVQADYDNVSMRMALAQVLMQLGRNEDAMYEARICLRLRPDYEPAKQLIEELSVL